MIPLALIFFLVWFLMIGSFWSVFEKAGYEGWLSLIPFVNLYYLAKVAGMEGGWGFAMMIPGVNLIFWLVINLAIARRFGESDGFGLGMSLLPYIFWPILGFGDARLAREEEPNYALYQEHFDDELEEEFPEEPARNPRLSRNQDGDWIEEIPLDEW
ncbi:MAG: DUF5684 domain-containing protein [Bacteroidota bacterium]